VTADGQEVLVVDGDENVQRGMTQLLSAARLQPTVLGDPARAHELAREKFFAVAVVDLDTPEPNGGLELVRALRRDSAATNVVVMTSRHAFEAAVEAFRAGARDIIIKSPGQVEYLKQRVVEFAGAVTEHSDENRLLSDVLSVHEDLLKRLMDTSRRAVELEERLGGATLDADGECAILVVESPENGWLTGELKTALAGRPDFAITVAETGGEALDRGGAARFQIALVRKTLPDLSGSMIISALKAQSPETLTILYTRPTDKPGCAEVIEGSKVIPLIPELTDVGQMIERIDELRQAFRGRSRERRYLALFKQENYELLKRYAELKQKIGNRL
jgi:DNA-binding NtrC family response regulator